MLVMWSYQMLRGELFALSTGIVPPSLIEPENWKRLRGGVERTAAAISKITKEKPSVVLTNIEQQDYHTLDTNQLLDDWERPSDA